MLRQAVATFPRALRTAPRLSATSAAVRTQLQTPAASLRVFQPAASRWYSEAKDTEGEKASTTEETGATDEISELKKNLEAKETEAREWKDKCLRTVADFRNLQDRTQREIKSARDFAIQKFAKDLVDSVDNLDRALTTVPAEKLANKTEETQDLVNLYDGLKMTENILMQTLAKHGLERLDPEGAKFDPNEHEATFMAPQPDKDDNTVFFIQQKGFKLNGRVLRAAKVGVVKNA